MRVTKLEHAALVVEESGSTLVIDPGAYTRPLGGLHGVAAIVVTHEHADHWTPEQLAAILSGNPDARVFGPEGFSAAATGFDVTVVRPGDTIVAGPFRLRFFGGKHNEIHASIPIVDNVGVLVNETLYYPGDSWAVPDAPVEVLAAPASAPWLKIGDAMDFILAVAPRHAFATHETINSAAGQAMANGRLGWATEQGGGVYAPLAPGESLEV